MTGCDTSEPTPTGDALYADAEQTYMEYREFVNGVQSVLSTDPWTIGQLGVYGMQPDGCDGGTGYRFDLNRRLEMDAADREANADTVERHLEQAGMSPSRRVLGEGDGSIIQVGVRDEGVFAQLLVEFRETGTVRISAETACRPGDALSLADMLFGDVFLSEGYLPTETESPTDPLFFGITPGDPQFVRETPAPTETPAP